MAQKKGQVKNRAAVPDHDFIRLFSEIGPAELARKTNTTQRAVFERRRNLERKHKIRIAAPGGESHIPRTYPHRLYVEVEDGIVLVGSDAHYWPGPPSLMHRAFVQFARELQPNIIIMNGDVVDMAAVSRFPPIGWTRLPTVREEIEAAQERLAEILDVKPMKCRTIWPLGNHDSRFESKIAQHLPELADVTGTSLQDHFPEWEPCWSVWINGDGPQGVVVKHRFKGGIHAPRNNTLYAGRSIITGHLHSAKVVPFTDYNGTRYGIDSGCMADPDGQQFVDYTEDNPKDWREGFCVLRFVDGQLLTPELVLAWDEGSVQFRGEVIEIK